MNRESVVFYRSFMEATDSLEAEQYKKVIQMVLHYAMNGELPEEKGIEYSLFSLMKPQIDANNRRYENGKKGAEFGKLGGRPKKETPKKPQENPKEIPNDNLNVNSNVKVKEEKHLYGEYKHVRLTDAEYQKLLSDYGTLAVDDYIRRLDEYIQTTGKKYRDHNLTIRQWIRKAGGTNATVNTEQRSDYEEVCFG